MDSDAGLKRLEESLRWTFANKSRLQGFLAKKGRPAQRWLDRMQQLIDYPSLSPELRPAICTVMIRLSKTSGLHPTCLSIQNVKRIGDHPVAAGGFGDVWKGTIGDSGELVCLKVVKVYLKSDREKLTNEYQREAILWRQMKHPNVLPFLGIYQLEQAQQLCLISPWMEKGNLVQFLNTTKREDVDHYMLVYDVTSGLAYLHRKKIVHGDLKGVNILITDSLRACIADFGLSHVADTQGLRITTSTMRPAGTTRWLAPELLLDGGGPSKESDVYSYACVCYEIFTGLHPFPEFANEMAVAFNVAQGKRPSRPEGAPELSDAMWALMSACWDATPSSRPTASHVLKNVEEMDQMVDTSPASDWSGSLFTQVWENVEYRATSPVPPNGSQLGANGSFSDLLEATHSPGTHQRATSEPAFHLSPPSPVHASVPSSAIKPRSDSDSVSLTDSIPKSDVGSDVETSGQTFPPPAYKQASMSVSTSSLQSLLSQFKSSTSSASVTNSPKPEASERKRNGWFTKLIGQARTMGEERLSKSPPSGGAPGEVLQLIGYLTNLGGEDWTTALDICERASNSRAVAKEAATAIRRELKYGTPRSQLLAAKLWAIMLRDAGEFFMTESMSRRFLDVVRNLMENQSTDPVVFVRVLDVLGYAAHISSDDDAPYRRLWRRVKPFYETAKEGKPLDDDDPIFEMTLSTDSSRREPPILPSHSESSPLDASVTSSEVETRSTIDSDDILLLGSIAKGVGQTQEQCLPERSFSADNISQFALDYPLPTSREESESIADEMRPPTRSVGSIPFPVQNKADASTSPVIPAEKTDVPYKTKALYAYTASPDDPNELSFAKGETLEILDKQGKWWHARKQDGTIGIAPYNYLEIFNNDQVLSSTVPATIIEKTDVICKARALYAYTASPDDANELSFSKNETLEIRDKSGKWWHARKSDGTIGIAPSNYLQILDDTVANDSPRVSYAGVSGWRGVRVLP
ncbi:hypothetical protein PM082_009201 [Marasmius tenuissimus]|nr:hypothetical protein PM082_009201 [Marasmius tenuissimus]